VIVADERKMGKDIDTEHGVKKSGLEFFCCAALFMT